MYVEDSQVQLTFHFRAETASRFKACNGGTEVTPSCDCRTGPVRQIYFPFALRELAR